MVKSMGVGDTHLLRTGSPSSFVFDDVRSQRPGGRRPCLAYLRHLGIDWSPHPPEKNKARREYERTWSLLGSRAIEELVDLPLMSDALSLATQDVLTKVVPAALFNRPQFAFARNLAGW